MLAEHSTLPHATGTDSAQQQQLFSIFDELDGSRVLSKLPNWTEEYCAAMALAVTRALGPTAGRLEAEVPG